MTHYSAMGRAMIRIVHGVAAARKKMEIWFMLWRLALAVLSAVLCLAAAVPLRCAQAQDMQPSPFTEPSLTPIRVVTINSSACNAGLDSASEAATQAALQSALNAAAGGTLWIPAGCVLNLNTSGTISGNTTVMCAGDGIAGFHNTQGLVCAGAQPMLWAAAQSNITIKGCTFSNTYNPANYTVMEQYIASPSGCNSPNWLPSGNDVVKMFGSTNTVFTNNLVTHQFAGEGVLLSGGSASVTYNIFKDNAWNNGLMLVNTSSTVQYNWFQNSQFAIVDQRGRTPSTTGSFSNNTFTCTQPVSSETETDNVPSCSNGYRAVYICDVVSGCDLPTGTTGTCNYSGFSIANNIFAGPGVGMQWNVSMNFANDGGGNQFIDGAQNACGGGY